MSTSTPAPPAVPPVAELEAENQTGGRRFSMVESIIDNLSFWTVISAAVGLLYLVWATLEILSRYVGHVPSVTP